ncbi:hypothetical protein QIH93_20855 [Bradyrhizobium ottawaense]|uniref:hypothetical protein n=1 Tax=Bradyrhizobium ottawaense TaxID=931866 RepID=UPI002714AA94|nr:hypothetical protein [Bradyrhizobium ottawaense]WLB42999.1 hypothetical protein QIH93_20855 [Bradyrhizobium ottawaense]
MPITIKKHEVVRDSGSYEVCFADGRPSVYVYWDELPSRRLSPDLMPRAEAEARAKAIARAELDKLTAGA